MRQAHNEQNRNIDHFTAGILAVQPQEKSAQVFSE